LISVRAFESDGLQWGAPHRHATEGDDDGDVLVLDFLCSLLDDLGFLVVVAGLGIDSSGVVEQVEASGWDPLRRL